MKVLHIIKGLGLAGAEKHLITLLAGLREQGIDARLLLWVSPARQADDIVAAAARYGIPCERWIIPRHIAPGFFMKLARYLRREKPDIVHTHLVHAETYGIPAARLSGIKTIVNSSHNDDPFRKHPVFRLRSRMLWRMTTRGIAISRHIRRFLVDVEGARENQVDVIYYGFQPEAVSPDVSLREALSLGDDARIVGSICRLVPQKGVAYALEAVAQLVDEYPNLHYVIVGDGVLRDELTAQARRLNLEKHVHFLGWRTDSQALMADFDIFLAPSLWEGFGLVFLEAMAAAKPIISTRVSSIPEVIADGETGILVPPQDSKALAGAIKQLLDDPEGARRMGTAGRARLERIFGQGRMIEQTAELYKRLMAKT